MTQRSQKISTECFKNLHAEALSEFSTLKRVSHRLAMTEAGQKLENVLHVLLPRLLKRIGFNQQRIQDLLRDGPSRLVSLLKQEYDNIHSKIVETLSHIIKRVRADHDCKLPCNAVLSLLVDKQSTTAHFPTQLNPFTLNLSLAFLTIGLPRCTPEDNESLFPGLVIIMGSHSPDGAFVNSTARKCQCFQISHLLLRAIQSIVSASRNSLITKNKEKLEKSIKDGLSQQHNDFIREAKLACRNNPKTRDAVYQLLMDVLLFQPSVQGSSLPPPGLSQFSNERLLSGASLEKNWIAEFGKPSSLRNLKLNILDLIAPSRCWALFESACFGNKNVDDDDGRARTVSLLTMASGDVHADVRERASLYLKSHMDSLRNVSNHTTNKGDYTLDISTELLGKPITIACELFSYVLGEIVAENTPSVVGKKGLFFSISMNTGMRAHLSKLNNDDRLAVMSMKRRMVSERSAIAVINFVAIHVFDNNPRIFSSFHNRNKNGEIKVESSLQKDGMTVLGFGNLALLALKKYLSSGANISGEKTQIASAFLLNSLSIRLASFYDNVFNYIKETKLNPASKEMVILEQMHELLSQCMASASSIITIASSSHLGDSKEGIEARDSCYGVIITIFRSRVIMTGGGMLFCRGNISSSVDSSSSERNGMSFESASLLFGCVAHENDSLRPRVCAALDALLAGYCKVLNDKWPETSNQSVIQPDNPWSSLTNLSSKSLTKTLNTPPYLTQELLPMLWNAALSSRPKASRHTVVKWADDLMKDIDLIKACHLLLFLCGDTDSTVSSLAKKRLDIATTQEGNITCSTVDGSPSIDLPDFSSVITTIFPKVPSKLTFDNPTYLKFSPQGQVAAIRFALKCLLSDFYGAEDKAIEYFLFHLSQTLTLFLINSKKASCCYDLLDECSFCLASCLRTSQSARRLIVNKLLPLQIESIVELTINCNSSKARKYFALSCGYLLEDVNVWVDSMNDGVGNIIHHISKIVMMCSAKLNEMNINLFMAGEVHGSAFLGSTCIRALRLLSQNHHYSEMEDTVLSKCWVTASRILSALGRGSVHSDENVWNACTQGLRISLSFDEINAPILDERMYEGTTNAITQLDSALRKYGNGDHTDPFRASLIAETAGIVLASSTSASGKTQMLVDGVTTLVGIGVARLSLVDALFGLLGSSAIQKDPDISLVVGEALTKYADAYYCPNEATWSTPPSQVSDQFDETYSLELPPFSQVVYTFMKREINSSNPLKRTATVTAILALVSHAATITVKSSNKGSENRAFVIEVLKYIEKFQSIFISILADPKSKHLARESCCIGLVACRGLSNHKSLEGNKDNKYQHLNNRLLKAFGQSNVYGKSALMETQDQNAERMGEEGRTDLYSESNHDDAEIGGVSGMNEATLGAYREMAAVSCLIGRPDILYSLLLLSLSHPIWKRSEFKDKYTATSLLGNDESFASSTSIGTLRETLRPHLSRIIPSLLRACHDSNKQTQQQMTSLWVGLTGGGADGRAAITEHLVNTIDVLIIDAGKRLWRTRFGACKALSEVIIGRSWEDLGGGGAMFEDQNDNNSSVSTSSAGIRLLRLFKVVVRCLDDVRISCRASGELLARSVKSLISRLCDPEFTESENGNENEKFRKRGFDYQAQSIQISSASAASTALTWIVEHGMSQSCAEATGFSLSCLISIVEISQPSTLQPVLPELIGSLLMAMSGLEPAALNYLQVRASGQESNSAEGSQSYERLERIRLQLAQNGPIASALSKCLDMVQFISIEVQKKVISQIDHGLRGGTGFATRAAAADAVSTLCSTCPLSFRFSGSSMTNPTVRLLRALYHSSERERGAGARDKMTHALGNLAELAPGKSVRSLAVRACERYKAATGSNDDPVIRKAAAKSLQAIATRASNQFSEGGRLDVWCKLVLPIAFLGRKSNSLSSIWNDVWEEGGQVANLSPSLQNCSFHGEGNIHLEEKLIPYIANHCIEAVTDVSWARRVVACDSISELAQMNILAPLTEKHDNNEVNLFRQNRRAKASTKLLEMCVQMIVKGRIWDGKASLVKATVNIATKWVQYGLNDKYASLGTSFTPITHSNSWNDLFVNDNWFNSEAVEDNVFDENKDIEKLIKTKNDSNCCKEDNYIIDFDGGDKMLEEEEILSNEIENSQKPTKSVVFSGLCRAILEQSISKKSSYQQELDVMMYRSTTLQTLATLLISINNKEFDLASISGTDPKYIYNMLVPLLLPLVDFYSQVFTSEVISTNEITHPPLIVARSIDCIASAIFDGIQTNVTLLVKLFYLNCGLKQSAWTVRESSGLALANLVSKAALKCLRKIDTIEILLECTRRTLMDKKFWKVRICGLKILLSICQRAGYSNQLVCIPSIIKSSTSENIIRKEQQLMLEALMPYKEKILEIGRSSLCDIEPKVSAVASKICNSITWWP